MRRWWELKITSHVLWNFQSSFNLNFFDFLFNFLFLKKLRSKNLLTEFTIRPRRSFRRREILPSRTRKLFFLCNFQQSNHGRSHQHNSLRISVAMATVLHPNRQLKHERERRRRNFNDRKGRSEIYFLAWIKRSQSKVKTKSDWRTMRSFTSIIMKEEVRDSKGFRWIKT